jgi:hypothetical protein
VKDKPSRTKSIAQSAARRFWEVDTRIRLEVVIEDAIKEALAKAESVLNMIRAQAENIHCGSGQSCDGTCDVCIRTTTIYGTIDQYFDERADAEKAKA